MIEFETNHYQVVSDSLANDAVDENAMASLEILSERLERVKQLGGAFADIEFSSAAEQLRARRSAVAVM